MRRNKIELNCHLAQYESFNGLNKIGVNVKTKLFIRKAQNKQKHFYPIHQKLHYKPNHN